MYAGCQPDKASVKISLDHFTKKTGATLFFGNKLAGVWVQKTQNLLSILCYVEYMPDNTVWPGQLQFDHLINSFVMRERHVELPCLNLDWPTG